MYMYSVLYAQLLLRGNFGLCNSYIPIASARKVFDVKVEGAMRPRPLNRIATSQARGI